MGILNINTLRSLNKVHIYQGNDPKSGFSAFSKDPIRLNTSVLTSSGGPAVAGLLGNLLNIAGVATALDFPQKYRYQGTSPISFSQKCYLVLTSDVDTDYITPIKTLFGMYLPESVTASEVKDSKVMQDIAKLESGLGEAGTFIKSLINKFGSIFEKPTIGDTIGEPIAEAWNAKRYLKIPSAMDVTDFKGNNAITFSKGKFSLSKALFIKSVALTIPELVYDEGYPAYISIDITLETLRPASTLVFREFFGRELYHFDNSVV